MESVSGSQTKKGLVNMKPPSIGVPASAGVVEQNDPVSQLKKRYERFISSPS